VVQQAQQHFRLYVVHDSDQQAKQPSGKQSVHTTKVERERVVRARMAGHENHGDQQQQQQQQQQQGLYSWPFQMKPSPSPAQSPLPGHAQYMHHMTQNQHQSQIWLVFPRLP